MVSAIPHAEGCTDTHVCAHGHAARGTAGWRLRSIARRELHGFRTLFCHMVCCPGLFGRAAAPPPLLSKGSSLSEVSLSEESKDGRRSLRGTVQHGLKKTGSVVNAGFKATGSVVNAGFKATQQSIATLRDLGSQLRALGVDWLERLNELSEEVREILHKAVVRVQARLRGMLVRLRRRRGTAALNCNDTDSEHTPCLTCQAGGHADAFRRDGGDGRFIVKETLSREQEVYEGLQADETIREYVPKYGGEIERTGSVKDSYTRVRIEDLTAACTRPCVMDIKMGTRTFLECEVKSDKRRPDLAEKLAKLGGALTDEEREKGITKLRYMQFREETSSTATLGWRIEAIVKPPPVGAPPGTPSVKLDTKSLREPHEIMPKIAEFIGGRRHVGQCLLQRLLALRAALEASPFFLEHEFVGSSLLFVFDEACVRAPNGAAAKRLAAAPSAWMIDFAKTLPVAPDKLAAYSHREPWVCGNQHDGYLLGLDSLIAQWEQLLSAEPDSPYLGLIVEDELRASAVSAPDGPPAAAEAPNTRPPSGAAAQPPEDTPDGLRPFYGVAEEHMLLEHAAALEAFELEACLKGLGLRKGVLALAREGVASVQPEEALALRQWWDALHPRSRVVITSKVKALQAPEAVLRVACALAGSQRRRLTCASVDELRTVLLDVGIDNADSLAQLTASATPGAPIDLAGWRSALAPDTRAMLLELVLDELPPLVD